MCIIKLLWRETPEIFSLNTFPQAILGHAACLKTMMKYNDVVGNPSSGDCSCMTATDPFVSPSWFLTQGDLNACLVENDLDQVVFTGSDDDKRNTIIVLLSNLGLCSVSECQGELHLVNTR